MSIKALLKKGIEQGTFKDILYKYREFGERTNEIIINSEFYFAPPNSFNDPFDCNLSYKDKYSKQEILQSYKWYVEKYPHIKVSDLKQHFGIKAKTFTKGFSKLYSDMANNTGILSLSTDNKNITMWSHYARNHTGLVFELDVKEDYDFFDLYGIVEYKDEYQLLSYAKDRAKELPKQFLTKYTDWEYEKEIRIINYKQFGIKKFNKSTLKTIYFGCKANKSDIRHIIQLCKNYGFEHVEFQKAEMKKGEFAIEFNKIT
ncbi:MAG: DUF2971 domain-containing protein [Sulfurimonadaceae bacterium]|jgi:hypothetical protein|nr:DUF2971 domain-containing protein [Sulfurimonadaceae bacterium]